MTNSRLMPTAMLCFGLLTGCSGSDPATPIPASQPLGTREANDYMVSSAHPLATEAGLDMLRQGGNAVDAAVAVQMVLGFIESPETGIGGGGFLLLQQAGSAQAIFYDGRETAPKAATADRFQVLGRALPRSVAIPSGSSVGVPGLIAMLAQAHEEHGQLPWATTLAPAIALAEQGLPMPARLQRQIEADWSLRLFADTRRYYRAQAGTDTPTLRSPELAQTLRQLAEQGPSSFYQGPIAEALLERVNNARWGAGDMTARDLAGYQAIRRDAVCAPYRQWTLCGAPPPSSGGISVLQIMGMLERFPLAELAPDSAAAIHLITEASRLAFADRTAYIGDPDFVHVPVEGLLDPAYLRQRAALINPDEALPHIHPGAPGRQAELQGRILPAEADERGTSHFSIVDAQGNLLALTSSNEAPFGSRMLSQGFVLNNQLTDFSFRPLLEDEPHPNAVAGGKRPRSSMAPIIVLQADGTPRMVIGSRGGSRIIGYVVKALTGVLDWNMDIQDAIARPNHLDRGLGLEIEAGTPLEERVSELKALGHDVRIVPMTSGLHGMEWLGSRWRGGADPRLDGVARGD